MKVFFAASTAKLTELEYAGRVTAARLARALDAEVLIARLTGLVLIVELLTVAVRV